MGVRQLLQNVRSSTHSSLNKKANASLCSYGRHSNSIRPDEVLCGACRTGHLLPLFGTRNTKALASPRKGKKPASASTLARAYLHPDTNFYAAHSETATDALDGLQLEDLRYNEDEVEDLADEIHELDLGSCVSDED